MTGDAACAGAGCARRVARVIEAYVETAQGRKRPQILRGRIGVTDAADRTRLICKLLRVATGAGHVPGAHGLRARAFAPVAEQARQARVVRVRVAKLGEVYVRRLRARLLRAGVG